MHQLSDQIQVRVVEHNTNKHDLEEYECKSLKRCCLAKGGEQSYQKNNSSKVFKSKSEQFKREMPPCE